MTENCAYHFKHCILTEEQVKKIRLYLINKGLVDDSNTEEDFLYLFKGVGNPTCKRIVWKSSMTLLSILVYEIRDPFYRPEWIVAEKVFADVKARSLRDIHSKPFSSDSSRSFDTFFSNQKEIRQVVSTL